MVCPTLSRVEVGENKGNSKRQSKFSKFLGILNYGSVIPAARIILSLLEMWLG